LALSAGAALATKANRAETVRIRVARKSLVGDGWKRLAIIAALSAAIHLWPASAPSSPVDGAVPAEAATRVAIKLDTPRKGWIGITLRGRRGSTVAIAEQGPGGVLEPVTTIKLRRSKARKRLAVRWRCDRRVRKLVATTAVSGVEQRATDQIRTPSCLGRLEAYIRPLRPSADSRATVRVGDRWRIGDLGGQVCLADARGDRSCTPFVIAPGRERTAVRIDVGRPGAWTMEVTTDWTRRLRQPFEVRSPGEHMRLLATGDSMIQYVDTSLMKQLEPAVEVRSDARISTGISKLAGLDWVTHARQQAAGYRADATVVLIGANDGFPLRSHNRKVRCCFHAWIRSYASRVRRMMRAYARRGRGQVYWLTLPAPQPEHWRPIYRAVNAAIRIAARSFGEEIQVVDLGRVFTPGGRFRRTMKWQGHEVVVRQGDGVHLTPAGASIAAQLVAGRLRAGPIIE
jgi:lysophospholipase L1-like esterase